MRVTGDPVRTPPFPGTNDMQDPCLVQYTQGKTLASFPSFLLVFGKI